MKQTVLITGASSGIGREFAREFGQNGYDLILVARSEEKLKNIQETIERKCQVSVTVIPMDLAHTDAAEELKKKVDSLRLSVNILINNAGFGYRSGFLDSEWSRQKEMMDVNMNALVQMTYVFGQDMRKDGHGKILNVASIAAFCPGPNMSIYYASKAFVLSFSQAVNEELAGTGVSVTALCPGPTTTNFEHAANLESSRMFKSFKPATAASVAHTGFQALASEKPVAYCGAVGKVMNVGSHFFTRRAGVKFAAYINGKDNGDK